MKTYFITGTFGFIGYYLAKRLLGKNKDLKIIDLDSMND